MFHRLGSKVQYFTILSFFICTLFVWQNFLMKELAYDRCIIFFFVSTFDFLMIWCWLYIWKLIKENCKISYIYIFFFMLIYSNFLMNLLKKNILEPSMSLIPLNMDSFYPPLIPQKISENDINFSTRMFWKSQRWHWVHRGDITMHRALYVPLGALTSSHSPSVPSIIALLIPIKNTMREKSKT